MDASVEEALKNDTVIDITTTGRKSGEARRIEIWFHNHADCFWYALLDHSLLYHTLPL